MLLMSRRDNMSEKGNGSKPVQRYRITTNGTA